MALENLGAKGSRRSSHGALPARWGKQEKWEETLMMKPIRRFLPCMLLASVAFSGTAIAQTAGGTPTLTSTTVLKDRDNVVWDLAFLPDGTMFFTERCGGLSVRQPSGTVIPLLGIKDSKGFPQVASDLFCSGQAGMAGVAIDPGFATNRFIYVYSASSMTAPGNNRVLRLTVSPDLRSVSNRQDIVTDIAYKPAKSDHPFGDPGAHNGGRLR
ncbi:MAG: PQQ-dependent sugar dehydrogenase, partial [Allorhizobium sp.]